MNILQRHLWTFMDAKITNISANFFISPRASISTWLSIWSRSQNHNEYKYAVHFIFICWRATWYENGGIQTKLRKKLANWIESAPQIKSEEFRLFVKKKLGALMFHRCIFNTISNFDSINWNSNEFTVSKSFNKFWRELKSQHKFLVIWLNWSSETAFRFFKL